MTIHLGDVPAGSTLYIPFASFNSSGASVTLTGLATTDVEIYKNGSATQRASDNGFALLDTDGIDFDGITGIHGFSVDLNDNSDSGFFAVGSFYWVVVSSVTIDSQTVNFIAATFRIRAAEHTAGYPVVTIKDGTGTGEIDTTSGGVLVAAIANNAITSASIASDAITAAKVASDVSAEIADAVWDEDATGHQTGGTFGQAIGDPGANTETLYKAIVTDPAGTNIAADVIALKAETATILADTNELQTDWANGGRLDNILDARASQSSVDTVDSIVDSILADTADMQPKLGTPAGVSMSADIAAVKAQTAAIETDTQDLQTQVGTDGAGLTNIPWNASWDAEVQSEVQDAIEANHLDHLLAVTYDPASKPGAADALLNELVESDSGVSRFTANALEQAPSGSGSGATAQEVWEYATRTLTAIDEDSTTLDIDGAIRAAVGLSDNNLAVLLDYIQDTIALRIGTAQAGGSTTITLDSGASSTDSYYVGTLVALLSGTGAGQCRPITAYVGSTRVATVPAWTTNPDNTTEFAVLPRAQADGGLDAAGVRSAVGLSSANLDTQLSTIDGNVDSILADTGTDGVKIAANAISDDQLHTNAVNEIRNAITGGAYALDTDANGRMRIVDGTGAGELDTSSGKVSAVLADAAHGGTSATLRLGGSSSTPALYVTNSGGDAVQFESTGGNGHGVDVIAHNVGSGINIAGGVSGNGVTITGAGGLIIDGGSGDGVNIEGGSTAFNVIGALSVSGATTLTGAVTASNGSNNIVGIDVAKISGSATAADNVETVFDTDFASNYSTDNNGWVTYPAGYYDQGQASNQPFPSNFADLAITSGTGRVTVGTNADKTGYSISGSKTTLDALNDLSAAAVNAEVDTALADINLDHLVKSAVDTNFATTVHADSVIGQIADNGAGFDRATDSLEAIRDRGDAAWTTATGFSTHSAADVWAVGTRVLTAATNISGPIADQVWEEPIADHSGTAGSTAEALGAAGSAGDPWTTALPGSYTSGQAGYIVGTNINATISSRASQSSLDTLDDYVDTEVAAIKAKTDQLTFTTANRVDSQVFGMQANTMTASALASDAIAEIQTGLSTLDAAGVRNAVGLASADLDAQLSTIDTVADAIKAKTDNLPASPAATGDIPTANQNADALLDRTAGVETNRTPRQALRLMLAALAGKLSGAATSTVTIRDTNDSKDRLVATVDSDGNRSSVTYDAS